MKKYQSYYDACDYLESLGKLDSPLEYMADRAAQDLEKYLMRMQDLLNRIGNPEKGMKYIHVTGTSGKGTTVSLIHDMLSGDGHTVGSTLSPATSTTIERIKIGDSYIDPERFAEYVNRLKPIITDMYLHGAYGKPSYFDVMLAIALTYFKERECDYVILEVGMGGRYDSSNVIPAPLVSVITNIGLDHTHLLGNSKESIAQEKAGIIKSGSQFFTTENDPEIVKIFADTCHQVGAYFNKVVTSENPQHDMIYALGKHFFLGSEYVSNSIQKHRLPCRFEIVSKDPLVILDGAHNVAKIQFVLNKITSLKYDNLHVIFGAGASKDAFGMLEEIAKKAASIILVPVTQGIGKSFSLKEMKSYLNTHHPELNVLVNLDSQDAFIQKRESLGIGDALLCCGSLYMTGDIRKNYFPEEVILEKRNSF